jgi:oligopeptide transport system permease protein
VNGLLRSRELQRLRRNRVALLAAATVAALTLAAAAAQMLAPYSFAAQHADAINATPGARFVLGADGLGRDILSRLLHGARISLAVGLVSQALVLGIGVPLGLAAGYFRGRVDAAVMQIVDVMLAIPDLLFVIILSTLINGAVAGARHGPALWIDQLNRGSHGVLVIIVVVGLTGWLPLARLVRGQAMSLSQHEFVEAARASGIRAPRILARHLLPNVLDTIVTTVALGIPRAIFLEAALSFLGLGIQPPTPSWGIMIAEGIASMRFVPHVVLAPSVVLALSMLAFNFLGDSLRDAVDPKLRI